MGIIVYRNSIPDLEFSGRISDKILMYGQRSHGIELNIFEEFENLFKCVLILAWNWTLMTAGKFDVIRQNDRCPSPQLASLILQP